MTDQLTIDVPVATARPVVIPADAARCWILTHPNGLSLDSDAFDGQPHFANEAQAREVADANANHECGKPIPEQLPAPCCEVRCQGCDYLLEEDENWIQHSENWAEAEKAAKDNGWKIGPRGEFTCPGCQEGR